MNISIANCPPATERFLRRIIAIVSDPAEADIAQLLMTGRLAIRVKKDGSPMLIPTQAQPQPQPSTNPDLSSN